jgi:hypothetical protein
VGIGEHVDEHRDRIVGTCACQQLMADISDCTSK